MSETPDQDRRPNPVSLPVRLATGVVAAGVAGGAAHLFLDDAITTTVAATFFGLGVFLTIGQSRGDGTAAGG